MCVILQFFSPAGLFPASLKLDILTLLLFPCPLGDPNSPSPGKASHLFWCSFSSADFPFFLVLHSSTHQSPLFPLPLPFVLFLASSLECHFTSTGGSASRPRSVPFCLLFDVLYLNSSRVSPLTLRIFGPLPPGCFSLFIFVFPPLILSRNTSMSLIS